jgi:DNA-binding NtrC family response regulator
MASIVETFLRRPIGALASAITGAAGSETDSTSHAAGGARARLLCVDDNPDILRVLKRQLGQRYDLSLAQTAAAALALIASSRPFDVIISDLRMPEVNGIEFLRQASQVAPDAERIILTGQADPITMSVARGAAGAVVLMTKPWSMEELIGVVEDAVSRRREAVAAG